MNSGSEIIKILKELKPSLKQDYPVKEIGLFGSYSDDTFSDDSDIDLLVELEKPIGWKFLTLGIYLEKVFNKKIGLVTKNALREQMKDRILNQVIYA